ncbi:MAG: alpha-amylase family glycosyl hydrolase [Ignavibacteriaceae bacterium]
MNKFNLALISFLVIITITMESKMFILNKSSPGKNKQQLEFIKRQQELDKYYSDKRLGSFVKDGKTFFRLFAPSPENVALLTFVEPEQTYGKEYKMIKDENGVWETAIEGEQYGLFYGFKIRYTEVPGIEDIICIDPYAKAVTTFNTYYNPRRAIVVKEGDYNWEGDTWIKNDWRDLIIYEMHIRDMTEHPSSGVEQRGTYKGLTEKGKPGGLDYIKTLGVNAVELLPAQEFANIEIPFQDSIHGKLNTWNPYERNHWGYMTAAYFAPESYYSQDVRHLDWDHWCGKEARAVTDFKDMVKAFHKEGIAVIMDVVYNHISEYEIGNFKQIDKDYYFRLDENSDFIDRSYCGNEFKTERLMVRRLIIESVLYWMEEYHVDGFRFDLGKLIDWETLEEVIYEAKKINPYVVFVCEPWGGGYDPAGFSARGWGSWNDQVRNGIKGENPFNGHGWIFGKWYGNNNPNRIKSYVNGTLIQDTLGLFQLPDHSVNYLESHDGYTLGDFIRLGLGDVRKKKIIKDADEHVKLLPMQLKLNKLAALLFFTSRGITMIHAGQEFARSKVIPLNVKAPDEHKGMIDHNSYDKDNETNYINYNHAKINEELLSYYKGLIKLRKKYDAFRKAGYNDVNFFKIKNNPFALGYQVKFNNDVFLVLLNANPKMKENFILPKGEWNILVNPAIAGIESTGTVKEQLVIEPSSGYVLKMK